MYKTSVYTLVNGNILGLAHRKQQKLQKVIMPASHWLCANVSWAFLRVARAHTGMLSPRRIRT